jgi:hypothetical protein
MRDGGKENIPLSTLTAADSSHQWQQLCVLANKQSSSASCVTALYGAWHCGGILFDGRLHVRSLGCVTKHSFLPRNPRINTWLAKYLSGGTS